MRTSVVRFPAPTAEQEWMVNDMAKPELTVTINATLDVDKRTAETCLRLVEAYVNANNVYIMCNRTPDGETVYWYEERDGDTK